MKQLDKNTPMHLAWEKYKMQPYYIYWAAKAGLDVESPEHEGAMWWIFSKGYEAATVK